jgi:hypothetical protein
MNLFCPMDHFEVMIGNNNQGVKRYEKNHFEVLIMKQFMRMYIAFFFPNLFVLLIIMGRKFNQGTPSITCGLLSNTLLMKKCFSYGIVPLGISKYQPPPPQCFVFHFVSILGVYIETAGALNFHAIRNFGLNLKRPFGPTTNLMYLQGKKWHK